MAEIRRLSISPSQTAIVPIILRGAADRAAAQSLGLDISSPISKPYGEAQKLVDQINQKANESKHSNR